MDHGDTDFPSQNFQLTGEESNKFPQGLRSLPLPKFDIDEHLQGHLRFDSLVETEGLLAIQGQGNNWIEDFTPVGSEIEYSSTAAESCLISRPKNVWSDATSSESVEMLLKSVVEDEMIEHNASLKEGVGIDGLEDIDDQTDAYLSPNNSHLKTVGSIVTAPLLPDICQKKLPLCKDVNRDQFQVPDSLEPCRNDKPEVYRDGGIASDKFNYKMSIIPKGCTMTKVSTLSQEYTTKTSSVVKQANCDGVQGGDPSHNEYRKKCTAGHPLACTVTSNGSSKVTLTNTQDDLSSASTSNLILIPGKMYCHMFSEQVNEENSKVELTERAADAAENGNSQIKDSIVIRPHFQASAGRSGISSTESSSLLDPSTESLIHLNERCNELEVSDNPRGLLDTTADPVMALNKERQIEIEPPTKEIYSLVTEGEGNMYPSCLAEGQNRCGYTKPLYFSKDDVPHAESTLPVEKINMVDKHEGTEFNSLEEVIEDIQNHNFEPTDNVNRHDEDTSAMESTVSVIKSCLVMEGDRDLEKISVGTVCKDITKLSCLKEACNNPGSSEPLHSRIENTLSVEDINTVDVDEGTQLICSEEVTKGKQDPNFEPIDSNNRDVGDTSIDENAFSVKNTCPLSMNGDGNMEKTSVQIIKDNKHSCSTEGSNSFEYCKLLNISRELSCVENPISRENNIMVSKYEGTKLSSDTMIREDRDRIRELTDAESVKVHSSNNTSHGMVGKAKQDAATSLSNILAPQNCNSTVIAENCIDEVSEYVFKESGFRQNAPIDDISEQRLSSALLDDADKRSNALDNRLFNKCDSSELVVEPHNVSASAPEFLPSTKENTASPMNSGSGNAKCDMLTVAEKDAASCAGQKTARQSVRQCLSVKNLIKDESGNDLNHSTNSYFNSEDIESNMLKSESANPSTSEQHCGSPTVLTCSRHSQKHSQEGGDQGRDERGMDPTYSVSDDMCFVSSEKKVNNKKIKSCSSSKESTPNDDRSFTFKVGVSADVSKQDTGNKWKSFPAIHSFEPQLNKLNLKMSEKSHIEIERELQRTIIKAPDEDSGQVFGCSSIQRIAIPPAEVSIGTPTPKQSDEEDIYPCSTPKSFQVANRNLELEEMEHYPCTGSNLKESCSAMPDLITSTTSTSAAELFDQPFTKLQQVQLRAQIFVYGSIMQATLPDEAHMISAFGETDGGRRLWEGVWLVAAERFQFRTSPFDTPSHSHSVSEQVTRSGSLQRKAPRPPSQSGRKAVSSAMVNSTLPLPSPVRSVSSHDGLQFTSPRVTHLDFSQGQSPEHSHHSSQVKQYTGNGEPCLFEFPRHGSVADVSQNSAPGVSSQHSTVTIAETNQVTPVRDSVVPRSHVDSPSKMRTPGSVKSLSAVPKSRKRKKDLSAHQEFQPNMLVSQCQSELISPASIIGNSVTLTSSGLAIPANSPPKVASGALALKQRAIFSEETCSNIEQSRLQAEDASALAASAVSHSQGIWGQLATQKNSGLISEVDKKLACAAIAAAAAAAVAKAAAAAAKVASDASLQAKLMADEALNSVRTRSLLDISEACPLDMGNKISKLTPGSILTGKDKDHGSSAIISVARKAAMKRVEAASAATKRAENMDAIVRAAELAAEAVSQAGKIIALDEPLPFALSKLVEASPEGHGAGQQLMSDKSAKANSLNQVEVEGSGGSNCQGSVEKFNEQPTNTESRRIPTIEDGTVSCNELPVQSEEHYEGNGSCKNFPSDGPILDHLATNSKEKSIQKGCLAEVSVDKDGFRGAWFSTHVLDVKDGKAYICYDKLVSDEGNTLLKEWISLEGEGCRAPRIRLAHPMTATKCAGTRKRPRETTEHYACNVGDRVDAWIRDGWWEGIVTEKSQGSDTKFTVHFPDGGNSSTFRAWNLRPSLVWKDGYWIESSHARGNLLQSSEDENPQEKRQKLDKLEPSIECGVDGKEINKISNNIPAEDLKRPEDSRPAILSLKDRTRSAGKNARLNNSFDALRVRRTSRHKERSGVVIGDPKPGKNRKFMEVSKHYMKDKTDKTSEGNDSNKFAKDLMPQTSRIWRSTYTGDSKGKDAIDSKPKVLKSVKSRTIQSRRTIEKEKSSKINSSNNEEEQDSYASLGAVSNPDVGRSEQPVPLVASFMKNSSPAAETDIGVRGKVTPFADKSFRSRDGGKVTPFADKSSRSRDGGKATPFADKSSRSRDGNEDIGKTKSDIPEPRRSVRRIQPTSRLLEGLQSSLTISRIPSFSRDKVAKPRTKGASSSGNARA